MAPRGADRGGSCTPRAAIQEPLFEPISSQHCFAVGQRQYFGGLRRAHRPGTSKIIHVPHIFLSYNREDQDVARRFAKAFEREGLKVWWDTQLRSGELYDEVTEAALKEAAAVVVLWSKRSVASRWVRAEATLAVRNQTLAPAMIEACDRPIMFELAQTADLTHWRGEPADRAWLDFLADVRRLIERGPAVPLAPTVRAPASRQATAGEALPRLHGENAIPGNLAHQSTPIIGRAEDLIDIERLLIESRVVTLAGPGGIGKTRLATEVGRRIATGTNPDQTAAYLRQRLVAGVWFVELAALTDPSLIASTAAAALDIGLGEGTTPEAALARRLNHENLLIVLDNCEHLVDEAARFCEYLLAHCPGLQVMATSREALRIQGETVYHVLPLQVPAGGSTNAEGALAASAVALFNARARAADSRFVLRDAEATLAVEICRRLDGLPLAIELAAARVATLGLSGLAAHLDERFRILSGGRRTALPRHQTLRATIEWSHELLDRRQQCVMRRLGVFPAEFTLDAAGAVCAAEGLDKWEAQEAVEHLLARSLLAGDDSQPRRYRMMESTREYAREKLREAQEFAATSARHVALVRECLQTCYQQSFTLSDAALRHAYGPELENLRAALDWSFGAHGDVTAGCALLGSSEPLYLALLQIPECRGRIEAALPRLSEVESEPIRARLWWSLGRAYGFSNPAKSFECLSNALPFYRTQDPVALGALLVYMGRIAQVIAGRYEESERLLDESTPLVESSGLPRVKGHLYRGMGNRFANHGDFDRSVQMMSRAHQAFMEGGAESAASAARTSLGYMLWAAGHIPQAIEVCREVLTAIRAFTFPDGGLLGFALGNLAGMLTACGEVAPAGAALTEAAPLLTEPWQLWVIFDHVALLAVRSGEAARAARSIGFSQAAYQSHRAMRQPNEERAHTEARTESERVLGNAECAALMTQGADLSRQAAVSLAMEIGSHAATRPSARNTP